ncbi:MAG: hypothetical protein GC181_06765 [Bacteroidetes bacterium]|nr:hypothetical protein [Bacteroidota bacterium]
MNKLLLLVGLTIFFLSCQTKNNTRENDTDSSQHDEQADSGITQTESTDSFGENEINESKTDLTPVVTDLYWIRDLEENGKLKVGFISLSDRFFLSENPDSSAIPNTQNMDKTDYRYFTLNAKFRKRFLLKTGVSENDSVFVYDYAKNTLLTFSVKSLKAVAYLNDYMSDDECPCSQYDYMIGFEINKKELKSLSNHNRNTFAYVGKANPFVRGKMKAITWKKISSEKFPLSKSNDAESLKILKDNRYAKGIAYMYETVSNQIFIQDYIVKNSPMEAVGRHVIILNKVNGNKAGEFMYINHEGASLAPLNYGINNPNFSDIEEQWTGRLFKNQPDVIFGFEWVSFGCPRMHYIDSTGNSIRINCDNRH